MKKIVLVMPTLKQGGAERVMAELANEWVNNGHEVQLILIIKSDIFYGLDPRVQCVNLGFDNNNVSKVDKIVTFVSLFFKFRKLIKKANSDFVLCFLDRYNIFTIIASSFLKVNIFISDRANPKEIVPQYVEIGRKVLYKYAAGIIAQTTLAKEVLFLKTRNNNIKVISNPLRAFETNHLIVKEKIILNIGRLVYEKGQHYLIDMMANLKANGWKLVILGDGELKRNLVDKIHQLQLNDVISLEGEVKNVEEWLAKSSIFAFSSVSEGFPNALVEAMASGLPCVSFDCDAGPRDIIENGRNGFLVPTTDVIAFTSAVQKLVDDENVRKAISVEALKISKELNVQKIAQEYLAFCSIVTL